MPTALLGLSVPGITQLAADTYYGQDKDGTVRDEMDGDGRGPQPSAQLGKVLWMRNPSSINGGNIHLSRLCRASSSDLRLAEVALVLFEVMDGDLKKHLERWDWKSGCTGTHLIVRGSLLGRPVVGVVVVVVVVGCRHGRGRGPCRGGRCEMERRSPLTATQSRALVS